MRTPATRSPQRKIAKRPVETVCGRPSGAGAGAPLTRLGTGTVRHGEPRRSIVTEPVGETPTNSGNIQQRLCDALSDCVAVLLGEISGIAQKEGVIQEAVAALEAAALTGPGFSKRENAP